MFDFLSAQSWLMIGGAGVALIVINVFGDRIHAWWTTPRTTTTGTGATADIDVTDLQALKTVQARFERLNCPEGKAAIVLCFTHFFHGTGSA